MAADAGRALVAQADAVALPLRDESVDLTIFSPPYFALRSYGAGPGEIGSEATPAEFLAALWQVMGEVKRVLKPGGSAFINLGDKYAGAPPGNDQGATSSLGGGPQGFKMPKGRNFRGVREKSLLGLPWAFALGATGMLAALGGPDPGLDLILRAEIIADKPNGLPESVRDRVRRSHEQWFHFTRFPRYYAALDEIRVPHAQRTYDQAAIDARAVGRGKLKRDAVDGDRRWTITPEPDPLGALPGSVWRIPSEPLRLPEWLGVQHYAAFASEWPRRLILAFSPSGICLECGEGRWPVVDRRYSDPIPGNDRDGRRKAQGTARNMASGMRMEQEATILGYACACCPFTDHPGTGESSHQDVARRDGHDRQAVKLREVSGNNRPGLVELHDYQRVGPWREFHLTGWQAPPTRPAVVLDCFGGVGTSAMVARALGRIGLSFDLSHPYSRAARWRIFDSQDAGKAISRTNRERQQVLL